MLTAKFFSRPLQQHRLSFYARQSTIHRYYSKQIDDINKELEEETKEVKKNLPEGVDFRSTFAKERDSYMNDYTELYNHFANPKTITRDVFPSHFYKFSKTKQSAIQEVLSKRLDFFSTGF